MIKQLNIHNPVSEYPRDQTALSRSILVVVRTTEKRSYGPLSPLWFTPFLAFTSSSRRTTTLVPPAVAN